MNVVIDEGVVNESLLAELTARLVTLAAAELKLYKSSFTPDINSVQADFAAAEADYNGYAAVVLTFSAIGPDSEGGYVSITNRAFFQATDALAPNTIGGAWIENAGGDVVGFFQFPAPVPMNVALAYIAAVGYLRNPLPDQLQIET